MARRQRVHIPQGHYHVTLRGNHQEALFGSAADRQVLNNIVAAGIEKSGSRVHAFCWMTNHLHLLVQIGDQPLGKLMQRVSMRYSRFRHSRLQTTGHLFERRYDARYVHDDAYFLAALRYIHRNPCAAGLVSHAVDYPWSSHATYLGLQPISWVTTTFGLSLFHSQISTARGAYRSFIESPCPDGEDEPLPCAPAPSSPATVGVRPQGPDSPSPTIHAPASSQLLLEAIAREVCADHMIRLDVLCGPSRARSITAARVEIARRAMSEGRATLSEIGRFLGRHPSAVCQLLGRYPPQDRCKLFTRHSLMPQNVNN